MALDLFALRNIWAEPAPRPGQFRQGYFERVAGKTALLLDHPYTDQFFPNLTFTAQGELNLPPGTSVALTLQTQRKYEISGADGGLPPYCVIGRSVAIARKTTAEPNTQDPRPEILTDAKQLDVEDGNLVVSGWNPALSYSHDRERLERIRGTCLRGGQAAAIAVQTTGDRALLRLGTCSLETPLALGGAGSPTLVIVAGTQWHTVKMDGGFDAVRKIDGRSLARWLLYSVILVGVLDLGLALEPALVASLTLAAASLQVHPMLCIVLFVLFGLAGIVILPAAFILRHVPQQRAGLRVGLLLPPYGLLGLLILATANEPAKPASRELVASDMRVLGEAPACLISGYSTVNDTNLRSPTHGAWSRLAYHCDACKGGVIKYAHSGGTFTTIRPVACAPESPLKSGQPLLFLGGSNDEFLWWASEAQVGPQLAGRGTLARALYELGRPSSQRLMRLINDSARNSLALIADQQTVLRETALCSRQRGSRFSYFQDFVIMDLDDGRSPERRQIVDARRRTMKETDSGFVDLLDEFRDEIGVSWFNDMIHLSAIGHRRVAQRMCEEIGQRIDGQGDLANNQTPGEP